MAYEDLSGNVVFNELTEEQLHSQESLEPNQYWLTPENKEVAENIEQLWVASGDYDTSTGNKTLSLPYTNYSFIILVWGSSGFGCYQTNIIPTKFINSFGLSNLYGANFTGTSTLRTCYGRFASSTTFNVTSANNAGLKAIIGIK